MAVFFSLAFILVTAAILLIFKVSPKVIESTFSERKPDKSLKKLCTTKEKSKIEIFAEKIVFALASMGKIGSLYFVILITAIMIISGLFLGIANANIWLSISFSIIFATLPFIFIRLQYIEYKELLLDEMETALSVITSTVIRTENVVTAFKENIDDIRNPLKKVFQKFIFRAEHNIPVGEAIDEMKGRIDNAVFKDWCDALKGVDRDRALKQSLRPIVDRLMAIRIAQGEAKNILHEAQADFNSVTVMSIVLMGIIYIAAPTLVKLAGFEIDISSLCTTLFALDILLLFICYVRVFLKTKDIDFDNV